MTSTIHLFYHWTSKRARRLTLSGKVTLSDFPSRLPRYDATVARSAGTLHRFSVMANHSVRMVSDPQEDVSDFSGVTSNGMSDCIASCCWSGQSLGSPESRRVWGESGRHPGTLPCVLS